MRPPQPGHTGTCPSALVSQEPEGAGQVPVAVQLAAGRSPALWGHHGLAALAPLLHAGTSGSDNEPVTPWKQCSCRASKASARSMHDESCWPQGDRSCACGRGHGSGHILPDSCESALTSSRACLLDEGKASGPLRSCHGRHRKAVVCQLNGWLQHLQASTCTCH